MIKLNSMLSCFLAFQFYLDEKDLKKKKEIYLGDILSQFPWKTLLKNKFLKHFTEKNEDKEKKNRRQQKQAIHQKLVLVKKSL